MTIDPKTLLDANTMARTPFELRYFVAGRHAHPMQQYRQLVVELGIALDALRAAEIATRRNAAKRVRLRLEMDALRENGDALSLASVAEKHCDVDDLDHADAQTARAVSGKKKEVAVILRLLETEYADWTPRDEAAQLAHERDYWVKRLGNQAANELIATGVISPGMVEALRQLPAEEMKAALEVATLAHGAFGPALEAARANAQRRLAASYDLRIEESPLPAFAPLRLRKDAPADYPADRVVESDRIDLVIGVLHRDATADRPISGPFEVPVGKNFMTIRDECPSADLIGDYKYKLALTAEALGASHLFLLDDDIRCPPNTIRRLWNHGLPIVGAWYARKLDPPDSASIVRDGGTMTGAPDGPGLLEVDGSLAAGCTLYEMAALKRLPRPWFRTTHKGTEDTYLTQLARDHGVASWLDRDLKVDHVDKSTGRVFRVIDIPQPAGVKP